MQKSVLIRRIKELASPLDPLPSGRNIQLASLADIRCVAFDFYGTMFLSGVGDIGIDEEQEAGGEQFFKESLSDTGLAYTSEAVGHRGLDIFEKTVTRHVNRKKEDGIDYPEPDIIEVWLDVLTALNEEGWVEGSASREEAIRFAVEFEFRINTIWPVSDLKKTLNKLLERNIRIGIISNSQFYTPLAFEALIGQPPGAFGFTPELQIWSYVAGRKKPSLQFYQLFVDELKPLNLTPAEVLYVGNDLYKDVAPANKLGMKTALYVGDRRSIRHDPSDLKQQGHKPDLVINELNQIHDCLV